MDLTFVSNGPLINTMDACWSYNGCKSNKGNAFSQIDGTFIVGVGDVVPGQYEQAGKSK